VGALKDRLTAWVRVTYENGEVSDGRRLYRRIVRLYFFFVIPWLVAHTCGSLAPNACRPLVYGMPRTCVQTGFVNPSMPEIRTFFRSSVAHCFIIMAIHSGYRP